MTFRTYLTSRAMRNVKNIIKTEDLNVSVNTKTNALGDDVIEVTGSKEEILVLREVFNMIH